MIKLQFVRGGDLASSAIAWFSAGHLSHVDAVMPDGYLLGARSDKPAGVRVRRPGYARWPLRVVCEIAATDEQDKAFWSFLFGQLGKPYDKLAIVGFAFNRDWRLEGSWYCSELQAAALEHCGILRPGYLKASKVTPVMLLELVSEMGAHITDIGMN